MAEFTLPLTAEGAVTAPTGVLTFIEPSAESVTFLDVGPASVLELPEFGWCVADGVNPLRLITQGSVYAAGGIAPNVDITFAGTGATRATATMTFTAATRPADGDTFLVIPIIGGISVLFTWKDTLDTTGDHAEIKRGATLADCIANVAAFFNGTGSQGTNYYFYSATGYFGSELTETIWRDVSKLEVSTTSATVVTFRAQTYGTQGNSNSISEGTDAGASWAVANFSGGTNATGLNPVMGTYRYFYTWYRNVDGAETGRSPIGTYTNSATGSVDLSALTASADTTFDYIRIYRTTNLGVEFYLLTAIPRASSTYTDATDDETLARGSTWNDLLYRTYAEGMPPRGRALAYWKGSIWTVGAHLHADYTKGTVAVVGITTTPSATVTFSVKGVTQRMVGRTFQVASTSETYTILSVNEAGPTAVLDREYEGADNATASFTIKDDYDACRLRRCVPFLYNQWPVDESPGRVDTDDPEGGTALLATTSRLFAFSKTTIVSVTGEGPESWEISKHSDGVGCESPRLVVGIGDGAVFLSHDGFYTIDPNGTLNCISSPKSRKKELAVGIDGTVARINWACTDQGYAYYDIDESVIVFGLPLDGALVPNYEVVFDLQNSTWTTFKRAEWTALAPVTLPDGAHGKLSGDREGNLWHVDIGESDGFFGTEAVQTLTGAQTVRTLTVTGTPYSTTGDGEKGKPVLVLYADGSTVAYGKVAANTTSALTLAEDLATAPAASDQVILGGMDVIAASGFTTFGEEYRTKNLRAVTVRHAPISRGSYFFSFSVDNGSFSMCPVGTSIGQLSQTNGKVRHFTQYPGDTHAIKIRRFQPGGRMVLRGGVFDLIIREVGRR